MSRQGSRGDSGRRAAVKRLAAAFALLLPLLARAGTPLDPWGVMQAAEGDTNCAADAAVRAVAEPLTLDRAIALGLCQNPRTRSARAATAAQAGLLGQARATLLPAVNLSASRTRGAQKGVIGQDTTVQTTGANVTLSWLLFDFVARRASIAQAEQTLAAALGSREAAVQDTVVEVAQAWYDTQTAAGAVAAAEVAEASAAEILKAAEARLASGSIIGLDVVKARNALIQAQLVTARARGTDRIARGALARVLGLDVRVQPTLVGEAIAAHPALRAARSQVAVAEARLDGVRAERWPNLALSYGYYRNGRPGTALVSSQSQEQLVALTLTIPLFDGFGHSYRVHEQLATVEARKADAAAAPRGRAARRARRTSPTCCSPSATTATRDRSARRRWRRGATRGCGCWRVSERRGSGRLADGPVLSTASAVPRS